MAKVEPASAVIFYAKNIDKYKQ